MPISFSTALRNARAQQTLDALDAANNPGSIKYYTAPKPATGATITTQTLLGSTELSQPSGTVADGKLTFNNITDDIAADADGDIAWARGADGDGNFVLDGDCGLDLTQAEIDAGDKPAVFIFNTLVAKAGGTIRVASAVLTEGNA
jgi:hypothetical protein